jgi:hypothetical protein
MNSLVKSIRPLWGQSADIFTEQQRTYHISFDEDSAGKAIAKATVNGHEFSAKAETRGQASRTLQETIVKAETAGKVNFPPIPEPE